MNTIIDMQNQYTEFRTSRVSTEIVKPKLNIVFCPYVSGIAKNDYSLNKKNTKAIAHDGLK